MMSRASIDGRPDKWLPVFVAYKILDIFTNVDSSRPGRIRNAKAQKRCLAAELFETKSILKDGVSTGKAIFRKSFRVGLHLSV